MPDLYVEAKDLVYNDYISAEAATVSSVYREVIDGKDVVTIFANWANGDIARDFAPDYIIWIERD